MPVCTTKRMDEVAKGCVYTNQCDETSDYGIHYLVIHIASTKQVQREHITRVGDGACGSTEGDRLVSFSAFAKGLEEHFQVVLVDLEHTCVERPVPRARVTTLLRVEESKTELTAISLATHTAERGSGPLTSCARHRSRRHR